MSVRKLLVASVLLAGVFASASPALAGGKPAGSTSTCRKACPPADTTAPTIAISSPANGSTVSSSVTLQGSASDNVAVDRVDVQVDGGAWQPATGTGSWSASVAGLGAGSHTLTARATDSSVNTRLTSVTVSVAASAPADTTAPTVAISNPVSGSSVSGSVAVSGTSSDNDAVAAVDVQVDAGAWTRATGTSSWSWTWSTAGTAAGSHTVRARATDRAGTTSTTSISVTTSSSTTTTSGSDIKLADPNATNNLQPIGRGAMAEQGDVTALLYCEENTTRVAAMFRNSVSGATSYVTLPNGPAGGWSTPSYSFTGPSELSVLSGNGPIYLRRYALAGGAVPTTATLTSVDTLGDTDSRMGALTRLASGGVVAVWHQQGQLGAEGHHLLYRSATGATQRLDLDFIPTRSSKDALVQHPGDGSVWLLNDPDAWSSIGAAHFTETSNGLRVDWSDSAYIDSAYGDFDADPENPDIQAAADPSTGEIVLAYQSAKRYRFSTARIGSYVAIARISPSGGLTFAQLPTYVERISRIGLTVRPGEVWLAYRPVDASTLAFDKVYASRLAGGQWDAPRLLGQLKDPYGLLPFSPSKAEFASQLTDGAAHFFPLS